VVQTKPEVTGVKPIEASCRQECLQHAEDATPWLVFSDWLEEDGQLALAAAYRQRRFRNTVGMELVLIPAGSFWMGGGGGQAGKRQVVIERDFYLGVYEVTQKEWRLVMKDTEIASPSHFQGDERPVESVSWKDAEEFVNRLNELEGKNGWLYRLPLETEWEYACRGGAASKEECSFHFYFQQPTNDLSSDQANFNGNYPVGNGKKGKYRECTTKVGSFEPNRLGLYDLHGNVYEWCQDKFQGSRRVFRGGGWCGTGGGCKACSRDGYGSAARYDYLGLRLARVPSGA